MLDQKPNRMYWNNTSRYSGVAPTIGTPMSFVLNPRRWRQPGTPKPRRGQRTPTEALRRLCDVESDNDQDSPKMLTLAPSIRSRQKPAAAFPVGLSFGARQTMTAAGEDASGLKQRYVEGVLLPNLFKTENILDAMR